MICFKLFPFTKTRTNGRAGITFLHLLSVFFPLRTQQYNVKKASIEHKMPNSYTNSKSLN